MKNNFIIMKDSIVNLNYLISIEKKNLQLNFILTNHLKTFTFKSDEELKKEYEKLIDYLSKINNK